MALYLVGAGTLLVGVIVGYVLSETSRAKPEETLKLYSGETFDEVITKDLN